ncbi:uncharacterized protein LOC134822838 [Bolinopsis microptera]|uniref:uncharacterized protein LOC134822838 n=1 Tax=Bolinopsis microptera TaxID=2820187 RepID=UPI003079B3DD
MILMMKRALQLWVLLLVPSCVSLIPQGSTEDEIKSIVFSNTSSSDGKLINKRDTETTDPKLEPPRDPKLMPTQDTPVPSRSALARTRPECVDKVDGSDYRGNVSVTASGHVCQRWDSQSPNKHSITPEAYSDSGLQENYCRNPDGESSAWCFNAEGTVPRWEYCDVPTCSGCVSLRHINEKVKERGSIPLGDNCYIINIKGFLKISCGQRGLKCLNSDISYLYVKDDYFLINVTNVCKGDPHVYQACGLSRSGTYFSSSGFTELCGGYFEEEEGPSRFVRCTRYSGSCDTADEVRSDSDAEEEITNVCDDKCDAYGCEDESRCNGYTYGMYCNNSYNGNYSYVSPEYICSGTWRVQCANSEDELNCAVEDDSTLSTCLHYRQKTSFGRDVTVPIFNNTRCSTFYLYQHSDFRTYPYCYDYMDQTNCSDVDRVGGYCLVRGHLSSVSKYVVCGGGFQRTIYANLCDNNLENTCEYPSKLHLDCLVHKHRLCDGVADCIDSSDETLEICSQTTAGYLSCTRSFNVDKHMEIPVAWLMDNQTDCLDGEDEDLEVRFCGGRTGYYAERSIIGKKTCQDVLLCWQGYVEFDSLCDGVNSCALENKICEISRDFPTLKTSAVIENCSNRDLCTWIGPPENEACHIRKFEGPAGDVFGVSTLLNVPAAKVDCNHLFGEFYVYLSYMGLCINSRCPLHDQSLSFDACPGQYPERVYTLANNSQLAFVTLSEEGEYQNDYFQCDNGKCIKYNQVCDLRNDCDDMSDESNCSNHMVCENTKNRTDVMHQIIPLSQKCDGIFDCFDLSDECNMSCGREILNNLLLKGICWLIGILALIFNIVSVTKVAMSTSEGETGSLLITRGLVCLIGIGNFIVGIYLIVISIFDSIVFGKVFCQKQAEWLTGSACAVLGVLSTTGIQLSLFAMTALSLMRLSRVMTGSYRGYKKTTLFVVVAASLAIAFIPLFKRGEDHFVSGIYYDPEYKLFAGFVNKFRHSKIFQTYYNMSDVVPVNKAVCELPGWYEHEQSHHRESRTLSLDPAWYVPLYQALTWKVIGEKVDGMFTRDFGNLSRSAVHFYGNDGVCLFKYFDRSDDATRSREEIEKNSKSFVWSILGVNLFCVIAMILSSIVIYIKRRKVDDEDTGRQNRTVLQSFLMMIGAYATCWLPFMLISCLHNLGLIDATDWYATYALTVLTINAVISPLLYHKTIREFVEPSLGSPGDEAGKKQSGDDQEEGEPPDEGDINLEAVL